MKAVRLYEYGGPENLKYEDDVPEPSFGPDSVLVETAAAHTRIFARGAVPVTQATLSRAQGPRAA